MSSFSVWDTVSGEGGFGADFELVRVELFQRNSIEVVALLSIV